MASKKPAADKAVEEKNSAEQPAPEETGTALTVTGDKGALADPAGDLASLYAEDAEAFQDDYAGELTIARLVVLQSNSPQCQDGTPERIEGATPGMLYNTVTKKVYDGFKKGVIVIPVMFRATYNIWKTRESGGGFVRDAGLAKGEELLKSTDKNDKGHDILRDNTGFGGNQLVKTNEHYILFIDPETGRAEAVLFTLTSTQLKKSRDWNTVINGLRIQLANLREVKAPMMYGAYRLTTIAESNDKGRWFGVKIVLEQPVEKLQNGVAVYTMAREFRKMLEAGRVKAVDPGAQDEGANSGQGGGGADKDEEIPF